MLTALLFCDDTETIVRMSDVLRETGFPVQAVGTLREARAALLRETLDVALVDNDILGSDGIAFLENSQFGKIIELMLVTADPSSRARCGACRSAPRTILRSRWTPGGCGRRSSGSAAPSGSLPQGDSGIAWAAGLGLMHGESRRAAVFPVLQGTCPVAAVARRPRQADTPPIRIGGGRAVAIFRNLVFWFVGLLVILVAGFWKTYFSVIFDGPHPAHHLHGMVMTLWVLLLISQAWLVRTRSMNAHRTMGRASYLLAPLVVITGIIVTFHNIAGAPDPMRPFMLSLYWFGWFSAVLFGILYALAMIHRGDFQLHARGRFRAPFTVFTALWGLHLLVWQLIPGWAWWRGPSPPGPRRCGRRSGALGETDDTPQA